jgi:putative transposase
MDTNPKLAPGNYYHIYNRANGGENLFREDNDYQRFLDQYKKFIPPVADTLAWVLMPNHFHLLVWVREGMYYKYSPPDKKGTFNPSNADSSLRGEAVRFDGIRFEDVKWETVDLSASEGPDSVNGPDDDKSRKKADPTKHFAHLFNAYANHLNFKYDRHGSLFQRPFKRKCIESEAYKRKVIIYIHNNPVHHGFCELPEDYPWTSYLSCVSEKPTKLKREKVIDLFGGREKIPLLHQEDFDRKELEKWLDLENNMEQ